MTHHITTTCLLLLLLACGSTAFAQQPASPLGPQSDAYEETDLDEVATPPERSRLQPPPQPAPTRRSERRVKVFVPPLRIGHRATFRNGVNPGFLTEIGLQLYRAPRLKLDANVSVTAPHRIDVLGPFRQFTQADHTYDLMFVLGRHLEFGPTAGVSSRFYIQQWTQVGTAFVPLAGVRVSTPLIWAPKWSVVVDLKGTADLAITEMVLETQQVIQMDQLEAQIGMRVNFGHGRTAAERNRR
ncbi:MAG: hypothetical protein KTR31_13385 [Myxococcales bacterium]|nr:hypothetical protein [Myxococcales bacterium]